MNIIEEMTIDEIRDHLAVRYDKGVIICVAEDTSYQAKEEDNVDMDAWCHGKVDILGQMVAHMTEYVFDACLSAPYEFEAYDYEDDGWTEEWKKDDGPDLTCT